MTPEGRAWLQGFGLALCDTTVSAMIYPLSFGIATGLFIVVMHLSMGRGFSTLPRKIILATILTSYLLHALSTFGHVSFVQRQIRQALIHQALDGTVYDSITALIIPRWVGQIQLLINDSVVIWRAWVLYPNQKWPKFTLCLLFAVWFGLSMPTTILSSNPATSFAMRGERRSILSILDGVAFCLSFVINLAATLLILHRLRIQCRSHKLYFRQTSSMTGGQRLLLVLVESGLAFCALQAIDIVFFLAMPPDLGWPKFSPEPKFGAGTTKSKSASSAIIVLQFVFNVFDSCFWGSVSCFPLIIFIFVHTKSSIIEIFGFSDTLNIAVLDVERPLDGSITEAVLGDLVATSADPTSVDLDSNAANASDSRDA